MKKGKKPIDPKELTNEFLKNRGESTDSIAEPTGSGRTYKPLTVADVRLTVDELENRIKLIDSMISETNSPKLSSEFDGLIRDFGDLIKQINEVRTIQMIKNADFTYFK